MQLSYSSMLGVVHCDYLTVTFPPDSKQSLLTDLGELFDTVGLSCVYGDQSLYQILGSSGSLVIKSNSKFITLGVSGSILAKIREFNLLSYLVEVIGRYNHKITRLDATADFQVTYAPDVLHWYVKRAKAGKLQLTRKELDPNRDLKMFLGPNENGHDTGTVYLGNRETHSVKASIYDKGHERRSKGIDGMGEVVRVELTLKADTGVSLGDIINPENVFYNYAARTLVTPPPHYVGWVPYGSGFKPPAQRELFTPAGKIQNIFSNSIDLGRAFKIAIDAFGDGALDALVAQFRITFLKRLSTSV